MSIFSRIFSKNTESNSHIRKWVAQEIEKVDTAHTDAYALFVGIIHTAVQWGKDPIEGQDDRLSQVSKQYLGDSTIFEIVCYTYYQLENWLTKNQPESKKQIALPISKWIVEKFYTTLYVDQQRVSQLVEEQLERYRTITGDGKGLEELHLELEQRILMTKGDKFDKKNSPQNPASIVLDSQYIKRSLTNYEEKYIPEVIASMQEYCEKNITKELSQKENRNQHQHQGQQDYLYGMALLAQEDWVRASKAFAKVISANPNHYEALVQRGLLHVILHHPVEALQDFTKAIEVKPSEPAAYLHRGKCYHRNFRQKDKSLADYSMAIKLAPEDAAGYLGRGELYDEIALHDEKKALENKDDAAYAHVSEEFLAAIYDYSKVITLEPAYDDSYANRGLLYARKARANKSTDFAVKAIADFEKAISLNWEHGYLYKQQDEMKELIGHTSQSDGQANTGEAPQENALQN
ncbi:MAG: hypothetical protein H7X79_13470 [Sporomusaceae bacterium]|nr:hypothetical protein [Sporomusaceae bacterium]